MLSYVLAGLALGSIYAIASASLVVTFVSAGVLNFAFGSMAYVVARFYFFLNSQHGLSTVAAALVSLLVVAPLMGVVLYVLLFRFIRNKPTLIKVVATIGLSVALPPLANMAFGTQTITSAPGLASLGDRPFHVLGTAVTTDQVITYGFLLFVVVAGTAVVRFTEVGLRVRAMVDSEAMTSLSGTNPGRVSLGVWAVSATLAGLAGILVAPTSGLNTTGMTTLMAAAFAAVVAARLRSLPGAVAAALAMGVITDVIQKYLPPNSPFTAAIIPSIPFGFMLAFLIFYRVRSGSVSEEADAEGPVDEAIRPANQIAMAAAEAVQSTSRWEKALGALPLVLVAILPLIFSGSAYWLGLTALGLCYGITFLTFTVVTGEGGMLWLSQITFAGAGALAAAQFVTIWHVPVLLAVVIGAFIAAVVGAIIGFLTIRLGDLYVGLATLTFGLLAETLIFTRSRFLQGGIGVVLNRPSFASGDMAFAYLVLVVFIIFAGLTWNLRRSTSGLGLIAVRHSEPASRTLGLSVVQLKVIVGALGAFVAAVGGAFIALYAHVAQPSSFSTFAGLVWLAVVVTLGVRSITAAALSGLVFSLLPGIFQTYVPSHWAEVPAVLFGLGALGVALHPEGVVVHFGRQLLSKVLSRRRPPGNGASAGHDEAWLGGSDRAVAHAAVSLGASEVQASGRHNGGASEMTGETHTDRVGSTSPDGDRLSQARLSCADVTVRFGGLSAVTNVTLTVPLATIVGLVGPNGAGKSTLFGVLSGLIRPSNGKVLLHGEDVTGSSPQLRSARGLARTFQHPELFTGLTVRDHLVLAHRVKHAKARIWSDIFTMGRLHSPGQAERAEVDELIDLLDLRSVADRPVLGSPLGLARLIELGRALASSPTVLLLDEPSSGLDSSQTEQFETTLRAIARQRGISVLLVEHDVELVMRLSSAVYVLDFGALIASGTPEEVRENPAVRAAYLGEEISGGDGGASKPIADRDAAPSPSAVSSPAKDGEAGGESQLLAVENLSVHYGEAVALTGVSFNIGAGKTLAVLGANGAGKSSLARAVSGLVTPCGGRIVFSGEEINAWPPHRIRRAGLVHLPEGRGIFRSLTVVENLRMAVATLEGRQTRRQRVELAMEVFKPLAERRNQTARLLSGGEQQMLSVARALATTPKLLIADEMSLGLAPKMVDLVFEGLARACQAGVTIIMIEQYVHRALDFADTCLVLQHGAVAWRGSSAAARSQVLSHYLGDASTES